MKEKEQEHPEGCECDQCVLRGFWTDDDELRDIETKEGEEQDDNVHE